MGDVARSDEFSNAIRLSVGQWIGVGLVASALLLAAPSIWKHNEPFNFEPDYRIPYDLSQDYWLYARYARLAAAHCDTLLFGDSVVWGQYVTRQQTLSHYLNELAGQQSYANLGLDGAHPAALAGLVEHYARAVENKSVILQLNPLWMSSPRWDLQTEEQSFNHPRLVPQFLPWIPCYKAQISERLGVVVEQHLPFDAWTDHLQQAYYKRTDGTPCDIPTWTLDHPYDNPVAPLSRGLPPSDNRLRHEPVSWTKRGITKQDFPWVDPQPSIQWRSFQRAVDILQRRGNRVFVVVGPFNEHLLSEKSRDAYQKIKLAVASWLRERHVAQVAPPPLPSELYADASHPLAEGYKLLARQIFDQVAP